MKGTILDVKITPFPFSFGHIKYLNNFFFFYKVIGFNNHQLLPLSPGHTHQSINILFLSVYLFEIIPGELGVKCDL
jgi:hypothetical protein